MQIKIFTLPVFSSERSEDDLNKFLRSHRVLQVERHFCAENGGYWAVLVEYMDGEPAAEVPPAYRREKKDVTKELTAEEQKRYDRLKGIRRELATQQAVPAYLIFTNEELAILAKMTEINDVTAKGIDGIPKSRLKDYLKYFYTVSDGEAGGKLDGENS